MVVASHGLGGCHELGDVRSLVARMAAKATHAIALLRVNEENRLQIGRASLLRLLAEVGVSAVRFEEAAAARLNVFARVGAFRLQA